LRLQVVFHHVEGEDRLPSFRAAVEG
jgi:hypothetical protein